MDTIRLASVVLAALELVPGDPSDLTEILRRPEERAVLLGSSHFRARRQLLNYLRENLDPVHVDHWEKRLGQLVCSRGVRPLVVGEPDYPSHLLSCWDAPPILFARGTLPDGFGVAIVGSRDATRAALRQAGEVASEAAAAGLIVISGLAAGIDTAAHKGALMAGGLTVGVMGTGIEKIFPRENTALAEEITMSGALLSQFAPYAPQTGTTFLRRNRVIAGLATVSLVMEGREHSCSMHEAEQALSYGRRVLLWQPAIGKELWARELVASGAAMFVSMPHDVVKLAVGLWRTCPAMISSYDCRTNWRPSWSRLLQRA